jgi:hypothetical protein
MEAPVPQASFLGLPPELRNAVYKLMLKSAEPLSIAIPTPKYTQCKCQPPIELTHPSDSNRLFEGSDLLLANKLVSREARAVLYGDNTFLFTEPQALRIFACYIGDNKIQLRHIRLQLGRTTITHAALKALYPTPNFQHLDLGRFLYETKLHRMMVQLYGDKELREAAVAFAIAGHTADEREARFGTTRICAVTRGSGEWEVLRVLKTLRSSDFKRV